MRMPHLTKTQRRIYEVLRDGEPHTMEEVRLNMLDPEQCGNNNVRNHISIMRKVIREVGLDIVRVYGVNWSKMWRLVRLVSCVCSKCGT